jgi:hypothetical protein
LNKKLDYTEGVEAEDRAILLALKKAPERKNNWVIHSKAKPVYKHILPIIG